MKICCCMQLTVISRHHASKVSVLPKVWCALFVVIQLIPHLLTAILAVLVTPGWRAVDPIRCRHLRVQRPRVPPLGPRSSLLLWLRGGPGALVVALPRCRCPLLVFAFSHLLSRWACCRLLGLAGAASLALFPLVVVAFRSRYAVRSSVALNPYRGGQHCYPSGVC